MPTRNKQLRVLLVEDDRGDAVLVEIALAASRPPCRVTRAESLAAAKAAGADAAGDDGGFDVILLDLSLPDSFGFPTVAAMRQAYPTCPIVVLTGLDDPGVEDRTVESGAQDYLVKGSFDGDSLPRAIRHAILRHSLERRLVESETEHRTMVQLAPDAILVVSEAGRVVSANPAAARMFAAATAESLAGVAVDTLLPEAPSLLKDASGAVEMRGDGTACGGGSTFPVAMAVALLGGGRWLIMVRDITESVRLTTELRLLARTDPLTRLANRRVFVEMAEAELLRCRRFGTEAAMLMVDVDHFKRVNDVRGHAAGDGALTALAAVLAATVRAVDLAARFGGEEFTLLLPGTTLAGAAEMAERIRAAVARIQLPSPSGGFGITVSIGATVFAGDDGDLTAVLRRADQGLYQAKAAGRNRIAVVPPGRPAVAYSAELVEPAMGYDASPQHGGRP